MSVEDDEAILEYGTLSAKNEVLTRLLVTAREDLQDCRKMGSQREEYVNRLEAHGKGLLKDTKRLVGELGSVTIERDHWWTKATELRVQYDSLQGSTREVQGNAAVDKPRFDHNGGGPEAWCFTQRVRDVERRVPQVVCTQDDYWQFITHYNTIGTDAGSWGRRTSFSPEAGGGKETNQSEKG